MRNLFSSILTTPSKLLPSATRWVIGAAFAGMTLTSFGALPPMTAHYSLDEKSGTAVANNVAGGLGGTLTNADPATSWIAGKHGGALRLEGKKSHVKVPNNPTVDFSTEAFTVSFWLRWSKENMESHQHFINKGDYVSTKPGETGKRWEITTVKGQGVSFIVDDDVIKSAVVVRYDAFTTGEWVHVVAVRDTAKRQLRLYANGVAQKSIDANAPTTDGVDRTTGSISSPRDLHIGISGYGDNPLMGDLDDVRIFRTALTEAQIAAMGK